METVDSNTKQIVVRNFVTRDGAVVGVARHEDRVTIINNPLSPSAVGPVKIPLEILAEVVAFATGRDAGTAAETFEATSGAAAELAALRARVAALEARMPAAPTGPAGGGDPDVRRRWQHAGAHVSRGGGVAVSAARLPGGEVEITRRSLNSLNNASMVIPGDLAEPLARDLAGPWIDLAQRLAPPLQEALGSRCPLRPAQLQMRTVWAAMEGGIVLTAAGEDRRDQLAIRVRSEQLPALLGAALHALDADGASEEARRSAAETCRLYLREYLDESPVENNALTKK